MARKRLDEASKYKFRKEKIQALKLKERPHHSENRLYKSGDLNEAKTHRFVRYNRGFEGQDGHFYEEWLSLEKYEKTVLEQKNNKKQLLEKYARIVEEKSPPKRINKNTNEIFKRGDVREDGKIFSSYTKFGKLVKGYYYPERWLSKLPGYRRRPSNRDKYNFRYRLNRLNQKAKMRAKRDGLPYKINIDYLAEIFPKDFMCPVLNKKMAFGEDIQNAPSIDKLIPEKGYIKGNVTVISFRANQLKRDGKLEEIEAIYKWMKKQLKDSKSTK